MVIIKPEDLNITNSSFDINCLRKFCDDDAFKAIQLLFNTKFKSATPRKVYHTRSKEHKNTLS